MKVLKINLERRFRKNSKGKLTTSDKIDRIVTNRILALPIFAVVMFIVYAVSVTTVGTFVTDWTNDVLFGDIIPPAIESLLVSIDCADWLQGLILDGIVAGVGAWMVIYRKRNRYCGLFIPCIQSSVRTVLCRNGSD